MVCRVHGVEMDRVPFPGVVRPHWWCRVCSELWVDFEGALTYCEVAEHKREAAKMVATFVARK